MVNSLDKICGHDKIVYTKSETISGIDREVPLYSCGSCGRKALFPSTLGGSIDMSLYDHRVVGYNGLVMEKKL